MLVQLIQLSADGEFPQKRKCVSGRDQGLRDSSSVGTAALILKLVDRLVLS